MAKVITINSPGPQGPQGTPGVQGTNRPNTLSSDVLARHITSSGAISASGELYFSSSLISTQPTFGVLIRDPQTGKIYHTGSYGTGGEGDSLSTLNITASGNISASGDIIASSGSFGYISVTGGITASNLFLDANTLFIGGTSFSKTDVDNLKAGKSISTDSEKKFVNSADATTYIRMGDSAKAWHYINDQPVLKLGIGNITIGDGNTNIEIGTAGIGGGSGGVRTLNITGSGGVTIEGPTTLGTQGITGGLLVTGSTVISGSTTVSGSFTVTDLLNVLGNYGQTGSFSVSGSTTLAGDVNADGQVTVQDLLTVLGGFGASGSCEVSGSLTISGSNTAGSPPSLVITGSTEITGSTTVDGPFGVGNLLDLLANFGATGIPTGSGEGGVSSGDINLDGQVNVTDLLLLIAGMGNPNILVTNLTIPPNTNYQLIGPQITVSQSIVVTVGTNSVLNIT